MTAHVIAVTTAGLEALSARFEGSETLDHRAQLLYALGDAYPRSGSESDDPRVLNREIAAVQSQVARSLPDALRAAFEDSLSAPPADRRAEMCGSTPGVCGTR